MFLNFKADKNIYGKFEDFWQDAKYVHSLIQENTSTETGTLFSVSHSSQIQEFNKVFANANSNEEVCNILSKDVGCHIAVSNLGTFVNDNVKVVEGPLQIKEIYCTDPLNSKPNITLAVLFHQLFWRGEIMIELGANKATIGSAYVDRYKKLYLDVINNSLA